MEVSDALYCPFCGQTLRRVFAEGPTDAPEAIPTPVVANVPDISSSGRFGAISAANQEVLAALVVATLLAARSSKRRIEKA